MAGAGYKAFSPGEVLLANDLNTYLMEQSVMVFGGTAARSSAIVSPSEGMITYLTDSDRLQLYNGTAWVSADETSRLVTTAGDLTYGTAAGVMTRLGIGVAGQVLAVNSGATAPEWATIATSSQTVIATGSLGTAVTSITGIPSTYTDLVLIVRNFQPATDDTRQVLTFNADTGNNYREGLSEANRTPAAAISSNPEVDNGTALGFSYIQIPQYKSTASHKQVFVNAFGRNFNNVSNTNFLTVVGSWRDTAAITSIELKAFSGNTTSGTYELIGIV
jgi:hypothetical protein